MPDVVERCPDCGVVLQHPGTDKWMPIEEGTTAHTKERCLEHQLAAARAEAERWRKQYEVLRAEVESVAQELRQRAYSCAKDWLDTGHHYHDGASDAYYLAEEMVRRLLAEFGGVSQ